MLIVSKALRSITVRPGIFKHIRTVTSIKRTVDSIHIFYMRLLYEFFEFFEFLETFVNKLNPDWIR